MQEKQFIEKFSAYSDSWYRYALSLTGDESFAKDCIQDAMLYFWSKRKNIESIENLNAYGFMMVRNQCYRFLKQRNQMDTESVLKVVSEDEKIGTDEEMMCFKERIMGLLNLLPERQKEIFVLKDIEGLTYDEIQEVTNLKQTNIRANLSMARKKIRLEYSKKHMR